MTIKPNIRHSIWAARRLSDRKSFVLKSAHQASRNAKRAATALNIDYEVLKDGIIYRISAGKMVKTRVVPKVEPATGKTGFTKGSRICLK